MRNLEVLKADAKLAGFKREYCDVNLTLSMLERDLAEDAARITRALVNVAETQKDPSATANAPDPFGDSCQDVLGEIAEVESKLQCLRGLVGLKELAADIETAKLAAAGARASTNNVLTDYDR